MSFDVFAQAFHNGNAGNANAAAARAVLSALPHTHDPQSHFYDIELPDGSHLEMYAQGLDGKKPFKGAMFSIRTLSDALGNFIFCFTQAADCVLLPTLDPPCALLTNANQAPHLPPDLCSKFRTITISDGPELLAAFEGGYDAWHAYRDRIVHNPSTNT